MKRCAFVVALAACAHPAESPDRRSSGTGLEVGFLEDGTTHVRAADWQMIFAADGTVRLPQELDILGDHARSNVLGSDACPHEAKIGTALYPGMSATGGGPLNGGTSEQFLELGGPAVSRIRVSYSIPYTCPNPQHLKGESTFTLFPDGRILRRDMVTSSDTMLTMNTDCGCSHDAVPDYFLTTFYAFASDAKMVDDMNRVTQQGDLMQACAQWTDLTIGMKWLDAGMYTSISPGNVPSFVMHIDNTSAPDFHVATGTFSSIMMIRSAATAPACGDVIAAMTQPPLMVDGSPVTVGSDGIYVDGEDHPSRFDIVGPSSAAVSPFAISLKVSEHAKITSSMPHDDGWYTVQPDEAGTFIIWFGTGLAIGETITIEPL